MALDNLEDRLECAIRHINTALDIDPWAQNLAVESMRMRIAMMKGSERKRGKWELSSIMHSTPPKLRGEDGVRGETNAEIL